MRSKQNYYILFLILAVFGGATGCAPSPTSAGQPNTKIDSTYQANISTLYGYGGQIAKDKNGVEAASNIIWKDSLGANHSLGELAGSVVVLNFWATWCTYCADEMPYLQHIADSLRSQNVVVIGVSLDVGNAIFDNVKSYVDFLKVKYQIVIDPQSISAANYHCNTGTLPWTFIIDRNGNISYIFDGEPSDKSQFFTEISKVL